MFWIALAIVLIVLVALIAVKQKQSHNGEAGASYIRTPALFTPAERSFLGVLDFAAGSDFRVFGKVRVGDVLAPRTGQDRSARRTALDRINRKHFDFILCRPDDLKVLCAIELNDASHQQPKGSETFVILRSASDQRANDSDPFGQPFGRFHMPKLALIAVLLSLTAVESFGQVAVGPKLSTRDEYRACFQEADSLKAQRDALNAQSEDHNANLKRVQDEMHAHVAKQPLSGQSDDIEVNAFNEKMDSLNARINASNMEAERLNLELYKFNTKIAAVHQRCAGMVVTYGDHQAVMKERREPVKAGR